MTTWVRYSTATGQIYEAAFYEVRAATAGESAVQVDVSDLPDSRAQVVDLRTRKLRAATEAERAALFPPAPDAEGFLQDLQMICTRERLRAWVDSVMVMSWMRKSYANLKLDLDAAKTANKVTQVEYVAIITAAKTRKLPGW